MEAVKVETTATKGKWNLYHIPGDFLFCLCCQQGYESDCVYKQVYTLLRMRHFSFILQEYVRSFLW